MISFQALGDSFGQLGNQLFQYAFLRSMALRLGVKFYCPPWKGDEVFLLEDAAERESAVRGIEHRYLEEARAPRQVGFHEDVLHCGDGTDFAGYFQSALYFEESAVRRWYRFAEDKLRAVRDKYRAMDFSRSISLHLRFGDKWRKPWDRRLFYFPPREYYERALCYVPHQESILVFSDEMEMAKERLHGLRGNLVYMEGNKNYEDLYLMSLCRASVCSVSTLSWWGAWLRASDDKMVIVPREGHFRPGSGYACDRYWCDSWIRVRALRPLIDRYEVLSLASVLRGPGGLM
jgi:hypothetical protein